MRVLHLLRRFPVTTQTFVFDLVNELGSCPDLHCEVLSYKREKASAVVVNANLYNARKIERDCLSGIERWFRKRITKDLSKVALDRFVKNARPDLIHCHFAWSYWEYARDLYDPVCCDVPLLISTHGTDIANARGTPEYGDALRALANKFHKVFFAATTPIMVESLYELGIPREKIRIIQNAASSTFLVTRKPSRIFAGGSFRIINVGRLVPIKGQKYLIEAFARFRSEVYPQAVLTLVGDGVLGAELRALTDSLGLGDSVEFLKNVSHADMPSVLQQYDLYVQPSIVDMETGQLETFGIAILEAIAVGLPVIVTDTGGMPYLVGGENHYARIVPEKNISALFEAIKKMFDEKLSNEDNIEYARERMNFFSRESQVNQCLAVYNELLGLKG